MRIEARSDVSIHIVGGLHAVRALLERAPETVLELYVQAGRRDKRMTPLIQRAAKRTIPVFEQDRADLDRQQPGLRHQGVLAKTSQAPGHTEAELESLLAATAAPVLILALDGVQDPHNLGACLRSAEAAGCAMVIAPKDRACGLTPVVRKVACGAAERIPFIPVTNLVQTLERLRQAGVWVIGLTGEAESSLYACRMTHATALVLGAEGAGLRRLTRTHCDEVVGIPLAGHVESLNVSVAAGIGLFEARRQRLGR